MQWQRMTLQSAILAQLGRVTRLCIKNSKLKYLPGKHSVYVFLFQYVQRPVFSKKLVNFGDLFGSYFESNHSVKYVIMPPPPRRGD